MERINELINELNAAVEEKENEIAFLKDAIKEDKKTIKKLTEVAERLNESLPEASECEC